MLLAEYNRHTVQTSQEGAPSRLTLTPWSLPKQAYADPAAGIRSDAGKSREDA